MSPSDRVFLHHFSAMIGFLALTALILIAIAVTIYHHSPTHGEKLDSNAVAERLAPVGAVYAGDTGRAALAEAAKAAPAPAAAYGGTTDGKEIYGQLCHTCHTAGVAGAPKLGDKAAWAPRIAEGIDTLVKHAIDGYKGPDGNFMPPKGGNPALTDEQVANTVKWIVSQAQ